MQIDLSRVNAPNDQVIEKHGYLVRDGKHLFHAVYTPAEKPSAGVIMCSPFAEEKIRTQRVYVSFARAVASLGALTVLFDYYGDGDSEGDFSEASFDDRLTDIAHVHKLFKGEHALEKTALVGLRWGATLAALSADKLNPDALIAWEPVVDTEKYFFNHLRSHLASQMLVEGKVTKKREKLVEEMKNGQVQTVEGYRLTGDFYFAASKNGLVDYKPSYRGSTLIAQISPRPQKVRPEIEALGAAYEGSTVVSLKRDFEWEKTEIWQPAPPELFTQSLEHLEKNGFFRRDV